MPFYGKIFERISMTWWIILSFIFVIIGLFLIFKKDHKQQRTPITSRPILTEREKHMFFLLKETFPHHIILTQVSFNAFMTAQGFHTRNLFNRKMIDFVITNQDFKIIAMIELDDNSHIGREHIDAERDAMIKEAGYIILRYNQIPNSKTLKQDIRSLK